MKKLSILITSFMLFALLLSSCTSTISNVTLRLGDYVQMGRYYDEPILWCCVDVDENGPLMLAERILTLKPFDAPGNHNISMVLRKSKQTIIVHLQDPICGRHPTCVRG